MQRSSGKASNVKASKWGSLWHCVGKRLHGIAHWLKENLFGAPRRETGRQRKGRMAEKAAADFLRKQAGYEIVARNWTRGNRLELDIVARDGQTLVFVEVRARAAGALVTGYHSINDSKRKSVQRAGRTYLACLSVRPKAFRFDVVEVELINGDDNGKEYKAVGAMRHHRGVFR